MSKVIKLKKGLDLRLAGEAEKRLSRLPMSSTYAVTPSDYEGVTLKLLAREGDQVKAGSPLAFHKELPEVLFTSPVSGRVAEIRRGEKRRILEIIVENDYKQDAEKFATGGFESMERGKVAELLLKSGLWPYIMQRPYGIIANPADMPRDIFVSGFDSAPLAPDMDFLLDGQADSLRAGFSVLQKLTSGKVFLGLRDGGEGVLGSMPAERRAFRGLHPVGNVGVQIHHTAPVNRGEVVWTVDVQGVAMIGRFFLGGAVDMTKTIALAGSEVADPHYVTLVSGAKIDSILCKSGICSPKLYLENDWNSVRIICGNVLTGKKTDRDGYVNFYANQITVIPEGDHNEFLGWAMPRFEKFSVSRAYFSWLTPWKRYDLDTNTNGGVRAFVFTGLYENYLPMDIYPMYLLKAILAKDIDKMENLGIYEVVEEDFALCEFVDPSKTEMQQIIRDGINLMIKELN